LLTTLSKKKKCKLKTKNLNKPQLALGYSPTDADRLRFERWDWMPMVRLASVSCGMGLLMPTLPSAGIAYVSPNWLKSSNCIGCFKPISRNDSGTDGIGSPMVRLASVSGSIELQITIV
jgi:hypothetical protein